MEHSADSLDLIVIGAGINGTGIARDASIRGLRVLLLDKGDISSGTTSWSTRLIHGGLRYLEHGELGLVRESLHEREILLGIAPHLVRPLRLLIPLYRGARRGKLTIKAGMLAYDLLSINKSLPGHRMLNRIEALHVAPGLQSKGLTGAATYSDAQAEYAERLAVENSISAAREGAVIKTYSKLDSLIIENGKLCGVRFTDLMDGTKHQAFAPVVANVSGPWVDEVMAGIEPQQMIGGTKGSHIVVARFEGAPDIALYLEAESDGRPFFIIPWNGLWLIGTTDIRYEGDLDYIRADDDEIQYLLNEANRTIPKARLTRESVLYTYSGVRPLPYIADQKESAVTRRHIIHDHSKDDPALNGLLSIIGGKLTTFRNLAEKVVDLAFEKIHRIPPRSLTGTQPLPGAAGSVDFSYFATEFRGACGLPQPIADHLLRVYGVRADEVVKLCKSEPELAVPFSEEAGAIGAELVIGVQQEFAKTLTDLLLRRTMAGLGPSLAIGDDLRASAICRTHLGWNQTRADEEIRNYRTFIQRYRPKSLGEC